MLRIALQTSKIIMSLRDNNIYYMVCPLLSKERTNHIL